jgi:hypothetical protein
VDGGVTWKEITGGGLPARLTGKIWVAVANTTNAQRVFVIGDAGLYRSDDGGATWHQMAADDQRIRNGQGGYNCGVYVDPQNPDVVYTINTVSYKSADGGKTFTGSRALAATTLQQMDRSDERAAHPLRQTGRIVSPTAAARGALGTTSRPTDLPSPSTTRFRTGSTARSRTSCHPHANPRQLGAITPLDWNRSRVGRVGHIIADPADPNTVYASVRILIRIPASSGST